MYNIIRRKYRLIRTCLNFTDLMCILLLSGIQKEDLDTSMLNKLQRHNVNIHNMNNNVLLQECTTLQFLNNNDDDDKTPQTHGMENEIEKFIPKRNDQDMNNNYNLTNIEEYINPNKNLLEKDNNKNEHAIQYIDAQPELQSVLQFWKNININNLIKTTEAPIKSNNVNEKIDDIRPEQKNRRNIHNASNTNDSENIQKILLNFLLKSQNENMEKATTKKSINIGDLYSDLYFLNKRNEQKLTEVTQNEKAEDVPPIKVEATKIDPYFPNNLPRKNKVQPKLSNRGSEREMNSNNFKDIINVLKSFKTYYPIIIKDKSIENVNQHINDKTTSPANIYYNKFGEQENILTTENIVAPKITEQKLSQNVIKEIAKTVKELVLKDLRKEIFDTTSYPTTALQTIPTKTKIGETISTNKRENQKANRYILNKFMELFEEIKTLNHKTLTISSEIKKESVNREALTYPVIPPTMLNDTEQPSYYKIKQYNNINPQKTYDFSPQVHKFRSNVVFESTFVSRIPIKTTLPITVQTNNLEIPPLGIPIDKPENPINQNIIVSTMKPYRIGEYKFEQNKIKLPDVRIGEEHVPKQPQIRFGKAKEPDVYYSNQKKNERFPLHKDHSNTRFNGKSILNRYKESDRRGDEIKHSDIPRFHEQLERGMDYIIPQKEYIDGEDCCNERHAYSNQMADCCNRKIASRQQMSLNNVKRQLSYDDTHFKNFLQSQQKVTDMLERILASRSRVRSVETA